MLVHELSIKSYFITISQDPSFIDSVKKSINKKKEHKHTLQEVNYDNHPKDSFTEKELQKNGWVYSYAGQNKNPDVVFVVGGTRKLFWLFLFQSVLQQRFHTNIVRWPMASFVWFQECVF